MKTSKTTSPATAALAETAAVNPRALFREYYLLTKPGIIRGNLFTASAGFLLAASGIVNPGHLVGMILGLALVIASGCVCNNYMDRQLDIRMARTSQRALVTGAISTRHALAYAAVLGIVGVVTLALGCNVLTAGLGALGFIAYVLVYGAAKRRTVHSTVIGSISGAIPPLVGYAAASHGLDLGALVLFIILVCWQMPHFYAIGIYRFDDYKSAGLPILPVAKGFLATKIQMILYAAAFVVAVASLAPFGYVSIWCGIAVTLLGSIWLLQTIRGLRLQTDDTTIHWARQVFRSSLMVITLLCVAIGIDSFFA